MNTTSSVVISLPSDHLMPFFNYRVTDVRSAATPPFSMVGISSAKEITAKPSLLMIKGELKGV